MSKLRSPVDSQRALGGWHHVSLSTGRAEIVRAVLEGVAFHTRWLHEQVERFVGRRLDPVRMLGGGAQSDLWCQLHADIMDRRIERVSDPVTAQLRGAGLLAGIALGALTEADAAAAVAVERVFVPDPAAHAAYAPHYGQFRKQYARQKGLAAALGG